MSMSKRYFELKEWLNELQEHEQSDQLSIAMARHTLRKLPLKLQHQTSPFAGEYPSTSDNTTILSEMRAALINICFSFLPDYELEQRFFTQGGFDKAWADENALSYDELILRDELDHDDWDPFMDLLAEHPLFADATLDVSNLDEAPTNDLLNHVPIFVSVLNSHVRWSFWEEWYQGFLDGRPVDWELQRRVALIPDEDWDKGPEHIAKCIEEIRARFELEREIASLKEQLSKAVQEIDLPHRLHNQPPPEAVEDVAATAKREFTLIWDQLVELEEEVAKPEPSPSKILEIARWLWDKSLKIAAYCGSVADDTLRAGTKAMGTTVGKVAGAALVAQASLPEGIQTVVKLAKEFAASIGGG